MANDTKISALCDEAKAIGKQHAHQRVRRYALGLLRANSGDIVTTLIMRNLVAAIDSFDKEVDAEFAAASERFARIVADEDLLRTAPIMETNAGKEAINAQ